MIGKVIAEGLVLGGLLVLYCLVGIRKGAVGMVFLYHRDVQDKCVELGLTTRETIRKRAAVFKTVGILSYVAYILLCVYWLNGARGFLSAFPQLFGVLLVCTLIDRIFVDELWVGHTKMWIIPGTEDLRPYIDRRDKVKKWIFGTVGSALLAAVLAGIMTLILK